MLSGMREVKYDDSYYDLIKKRFKKNFTDKELDEFMYSKDKECMMIVRNNRAKHY